MQDRASCWLNAAAAPALRTSGPATTIAHVATILRDNGPESPASLTLWELGNSHPRGPPVHCPWNQTHTAHSPGQVITGQSRESGPLCSWSE